MFRHRGRSRTLLHNLKIASLLSFVAGLVNVAGFLGFQQLTTNVTGHFAFFIDEMYKLNFWAGFIYFIYILFFFLGSFTSSLLIEIILRKNDRFIYILPILIETILLIFVAIYGQNFNLEKTNLLACILLFAMGLQNSLVTRISDATVRTTHLTGLFTDLGIELSQLLFYKKIESKKTLYSSIKLRLTIISFFFLGGIIGGILYAKLELYVLFIPALLLIIGLIYDTIKFRIIIMKRKISK